MTQITFDPQKLKIVKIGEVKPNVWNPKDKDTKEYKRIVESLNKYGQRIPIVVREKDGYEIVDGEQRWHACKELKYEQVIVYNEGVLEDKVAQELTLWYQVQVPFNDIKLAKLVTELNLTYGDIVLPFTDEELDDMKELVNFDWEKHKEDNKDFEENQLKTLSIHMTAEQYDVVQKALAKVKEKVEQDISEARAIELICADYLAGE